MGMNQVSQGLLLIFSLTGVYFGASKEHRHLRWSSVFGLLAQPFWFYQTYTHGQWAIFVLSFAFTALYLKGFHIYWMKKTDVEFIELKALNTKLPFWK